jgi:hypothetical protein
MEGNRQRTNMDHSRKDFLKKAVLFSLATASGSQFITRAGVGAQSEQSWSDLANYDALGLAELIKKKQVSSLELVENVIKQIERLNPKINAVLMNLRC